MYTVVVIGGIGSGKSSVMRFFEDKGALVLSLDQITHDLLEDDEELRGELAEAFGEDILDADGMVCRLKLAEAAFCDEASTELLNSITHPYIMRNAFAAINRAQSPCIPLHVAPVLAIEVPLPDKASDIIALADEVICVHAPDELRTERLADRGLEREDIANRLDRQVSQDTLLDMADTLIDNGGTQEELQSQLEQWWLGREANEWKNLGGNVAKATLRG